MLYIIHYKQMELEEAASLVKRRIIENPDEVFNMLTTKEELFNSKLIHDMANEIENADIIGNGVLVSRYNGDYYTFKEMAGGVKTIYLLDKYCNEFILESCFFGENCYKFLFEISKTKDIYIYENSNMLLKPEVNNVNIGTFTDFVTKRVVDTGDNKPAKYILGVDD